MATDARPLPPSRFSERLVQSRWAMPVLLALLFAVPATAGVMPRVSWILLAALGLTGFALRPPSPGRLPTLGRWALAMLLTILALCLAHLLAGAGQWFLDLPGLYVTARDHRHGARTTGEFLLLLLAFWGALRLLRAIPAVTMPRLAAAIALGSIAGAILLAVERFAGTPLHDLFSDSDPSGLDIVAINRNMAATSMLLWAGLAALLSGAVPLPRFVPRWLTPRRLGWALLALVLVTVVGSASQSGLVGVAAGAAVFLIALWHRKAAAALVSASLVLGILGAVPFAAAAYKDRAALEAGYIALPLGIAVPAPRSFLERIELWHTAVTHVGKRYLLTGRGIGSADRMMQDIPNPIPFKRAYKANAAHPHNIPLQMLLELGLAGIGALLGLLATLTWAAARLPRYAAAAGLATVAASFAMGYTAYGAWQGWWNSDMFFGLLLVLVLARALPQPAGGRITA